MTTPKIMEDQDVQVSLRPHEASSVVTAPGFGWMGRQEICAKMGVSVRTLRRLRKLGQVERRIEGRDAYYRQVPGAVDGEQTETEKAWLDVVPIRTGRRLAKEEGVESPRDIGRLTGLLRLALDQRDKARQARDESDKRQASTLEKLESFQARLDEVQEQRQEARLGLKRAQIERDELSRKMAKVMHQRDAAMVARAEAEHQRDELSCELNLTEVERDMLVKRRDDLIARLDQTVRQREYAQRQLQQARQLLSEWQDWRDQAEETLRVADERTVDALNLAAEALDAPWWGFGRRRVLQGDLETLLRG